MESIGERLKQIRKTLNFNQSQFSESIGLSQGALSEIENGKFNPSIEIIISINKLFGINIEWLLLGEGNKHADDPFEQLDHKQLIQQIFEIINCEAKRISQEKNIPIEQLITDIFTQLNTGFVNSYPLDEKQLVNMFSSLENKDKIEIESLLRLKYKKAT
ncbi:helix-turn-helix domain-containing protein [Paenibacillus glycanilyticus]|uniref:HTH cro/C1-type domain-containing protein n=1 Tax=Paenibacillus glycanilyticus TaxID=126569 RepID=A0ABQ6GKH6_9BACL|nr:helix-turn-helix transcriptional regulator [Paenibacillus glycanilyticus]GLX71431.1 hypothetical protein MU1_57810 [Paenibacillus glycanilyticus]